jgi:hypothetical protein
MICRRMGNRARIIPHHRVSDAVALNDQRSCPAQARLSQQTLQKKTEISALRALGIGVAAVSLGRLAGIAWGGITLTSGETRKKGAAWNNLMDATADAVGR